MSLHRSFILGFAALLSVASALAAVFAYASARTEVWELLDIQQRQIASFIGDGAALSTLNRHVKLDDTEDEFIIEVASLDRTIIRKSRADILMPNDIIPDFSMYSNAQGEWRLYTTQSDKWIVRVAQRADVRNELADESALNAVLPFLFSIPFSWVLVTFLVGNIIRKLTAVTKAVDARGANDTTSVELDFVPLEIKPLIGAMNRAFARSHDAMEQQKIFLSNAAHELRTPLAAMTLQIGNLKRAVSDPKLKQRVADVESGVRRTTKITEQLLLLARQDAGDRMAVLAPTSLDQTIVSAMFSLSALAKSRGIDLGSTRLDKIEISADTADLTTLVEVIIDNAVRYTLAGGKVDVNLTYENGAALLSVIDGGPGIHEADLPKVFDRFFRAASQDQPGSGLGLSIARAITERHGYWLTLQNRVGFQGVVAMISFPYALLILP